MISISKTKAKTKKILLCSSKHFNTNAFLKFAKQTKNPRNFYLPVIKETVRQQHQLHYKIATLQKDLFAGIKKKVLFTL